MALKIASGRTRADQQDFSFGASNKAGLPVKARKRPISEPVAVTAILMIAGILRVTFAAQGWPHVESDEAILGLMADNILWHGAHPIFFYGQHYLGSLQAYLAVPFFAVLGPTTFALDVTTTAQTLLFLLLLYLFTRRVYSPGVAWCTLLLLALGPGQALFYEMRAGVGAQDTLVFGALVLWLTVVRLHMMGKSWKVLALDFGIGVTAGLGLWSDFLFVPFIVGAALAFGVHSIWSARTALRSYTGWNRLVQLLLTLLGASAALLPFMVVTIASHGAIFREVGSAAGVPGTGDGAAHPWILGLLRSLGQQLAATLLVGLPRTLGSTTLCMQCVAWPSSHPASITSLLIQTLIAAPFSLGALACWAQAAASLAREARLSLGHAGQDSLIRWTAGKAFIDVRWCGRFMLVVGGALTLLDYIASRSSYDFPADSARYLVGLYLCTPFIAEPLWQRSREVGQWLKARRRSPWHNSRLRLSAFICFVLLILVLLLQVGGLMRIERGVADASLYGSPVSGRDRQVISFLESHGAVYFYTTYWVCSRLMFEAEEQVTCSVISDQNPFEPGLNRIPASTARVAAAPHPAYVFDTLPAGIRAFNTFVSDFHQSLAGQVAVHLANGDSRFAGYTVANIAGYLIYYYAGPA
jgi:hypothetical protein